MWVIGRYSNSILSESKFSRVFKNLSKMEIAQKTNEDFVEEYFSEENIIYNFKHKVLLFFY